MKAVYKLPHFDLKVCENCLKEKLKCVWVGTHTGLKFWHAKPVKCLKSILKQSQNYYDSDL